MQHELKTWPEPFEAIVKGDKRHEIRKTEDRTFLAGDTLRLREWDPGTKAYTGREVTADVTHISKGECGLPAYLCVMSIRKVER